MNIYKNITFLGDLNLFHYINPYFKYVTNMATSSNFEIKITYVSLVHRNVGFHEINGKFKSGEESQAHAFNSSEVLHK